MKTQILTALVVALQTLMASGQILRYQFNEGAGTTAASSGLVSGSLILGDASGIPTTALWGAPASGVSGAATDRALDLTSATGMGTGFTGPYGFLSSVSPIPALSQFTITGWIRPGSTDLDRAQLLTIRNGANSLSIAGLSGGPVGARSRLRLTMDNGDSFPEVDAFADFESQWSTLNTWGFFAISYDGLAVRFYSGNVAGAASLSAGSAASSVLFPLGGASVWIGADGYSLHANPFKGYVDDFRIYGSPLSLAEVEQVRLSAVPEPGSGALLVLGAVMFLRRRGDRRRIF